jgi:hypothetical protein
MLQRRIKFELEMKVPLRASHAGNARQWRYQLQRRGKIARLLKPRPRRT